VADEAQTKTVNVHGDMVTENNPPPGDAWYPQDYLCLRAEAVRRLATVITESETELDKATLDLIHGAMKSIVYTMTQVFPEVARDHRVAMIEVEAADAVKH
jgi:hypothetical protein